MTIISVRRITGGSSLKTYQSLLAAFLLITAALTSAWFIGAFRTAGLVWVQDYLIFIAHWMSEILIAALGLILAAAMLRRPETPRISVLFLLGMILSASFNAAYYYRHRDPNTAFFVIASAIFLVGLVFTILLLRDRKRLEEAFIIRFGLVALGILINFHLDIIVPNIFNRLWAAFMNSLFLLSAGVYALILILNKRDSESSRSK